ncbi:class I adenylate-forming enzyme family protein [Mesobacterium pallidum]|uniref:class I adenylate-forming enzyme family protein n=1 Tax=Mesobacterium pallidum TaxID=2872037 RepID=UPI001EE17E64|nr:class I adenylate-forming enzyme family protein [Mesobacterium pallidum]
MKAIFDQGAPAPCPKPFNMAAHVLAAGAAAPDKIALEVLSGDAPLRLSYAELIRAVRGTAGGLLAAGFRPGDRLLMRLGNTVDFPIAYLGAIAAGILPVPTSSLLTSEEVAALAGDLDPAGVLQDPEVSGVETGRVVKLHELRALRNCEPADFHMGDPDRPAYLIFTSGTSGKPRGVVHTHRAIWARQMMMQGWYDLRPHDRLLHAGAFNWTYTLGTGLMDPWTMGATALIPGQGTPAAQLPDLLAEARATIFAAAPGVYRQMLKPGGRINLPDLRHGLSAGEKMSAPIRDAWRAATGTEVHEAFGMSECSTFISSSPLNPADPAALGRPQKGRKVAILGEDGPVNIGEDGVIAIHRADPGLMLGYWNAPNETSDKFQGDWFLTGDRGEMNAVFEVYYHGRADDMMNAGGYRVSPIEVEHAMASLPGLTACAATDVEVRSGVRVIACFYTGPVPLDDGTLKAHAAAHLARYKQPRLFIHRDALPTNPNGKLLRQALRDGYNPVP